MFSLIVTIISIALVAALALATVYYGGSAFNKGTDSASATKIIQEGVQVTGALEMFKADTGALPTGTSTDIQAVLVSNNYLVSMPNGSWSFSNDYAVRSDLSYDACLSANKQAGINTVPVCTDAAYVGTTFCCSTP